MKQPEERILEFAIELHFARESMHDHSKEVAQRWARGERGSLESWELQELLEVNDWTSPPASPAATIKSRLSKPVARAAFSFQVRWAALATAVIVVLLGIRYGFQHIGEPALIQPPQGPWFVQLDAPLRILRGPGFESVMDFRIESGDAVLVSEGIHRLEIGNGLSLRVEAPALFSLAQTRGESKLALFAGQLDISSEGAFRLGVNGAQLAASVPSRFQVSPPEMIEFDWTSPSPERAVALLQRRHGPATELALKLVTGELEAVRGATTLVMQPDSKRVVLAEDYLVAYSVWEEAQSTIEEILPTGSRRIAALAYWNREFALQQAANLGIQLERNPGLWSLLEKALLRVIESDQRSLAHFAVLLDLLLVAEQQRPLEIARELWLEDPEAFSSAQIVLLASHGFFEFQREVIAQLDSWRQDRSAPVLDMPLFAFFAALQGDARGLGLLNLVLREPDDEQIRDGWYALAAIGLEALGESSAWDLAKDTMQGILEADLAGGDMYMAGLHLRRLELLADYRERPSPSALLLVLGIGERAIPKLDSSSESDFELRSRLAAFLNR